MGKNCMCIVYIVHNLQISMYFYNMYYSFHLQIHLDEYFLERIQNKKLSNIKDNILQIGFIYWTNHGIFFCVRLKKL